MRCIEINLLYVLKNNGVTININMRCIEMTIYDPYDLECSLININMRCIEMTMWTVVRIVYLRLTLTWDVLKYGNRKEGTVTITD